MTASLAWLEPGDHVGLSCTPESYGPVTCGGALNVHSIDGRTDFVWADNQSLCTEDMELDLAYRCTVCGRITDNHALYHDDLWEVVPASANGAR